MICGYKNHEMLILLHGFCHWCREAEQDDLITRQERAEREREARAEADAGIAASGDAGSVVGDDGVRYPIGPTIFDAIRGYLTRHETLFIDDLWDWAGDHHAGWANLDLAPGKYVGQQMQKAQRDQLMVKIGAGMEGCFVARPSIRSHLAPKWVFRSLIYTPETLV